MRKKLTKAQEEKRKADQRLYDVIFKGESFPRRRGIELRPSASPSCRGEEEKR